MSITYQCTHCGHIVGTIHHVHDTTMLGFDVLSDQELRRMVHILPSGDIYINTICDSCDEILRLNPAYHALEFFIQ